MAPKRVRKADKAYKDLDFLTSADARSLRILSEFIQPFSKLRREKVRDTIVFFGSARIYSGEEATRHKNATSGHSKEFLEMSAYYDDCVELSRRLTEWTSTLSSSRRFIVCSGGGPGIMEAANKGAEEAGGKSIGLNISLPFEQFPNQYITPELNFEFHYFFMRKFWFVYLAKAFVMFPGGFGTLDELMEVLTLLQTGKIKKPVAIILYGSEFWKSIVNFDELVRRGMISAEDLTLFTFADTPSHAYQVLTKKLKKLYPRDTHARKS